MAKKPDLEKIVSNLAAIEGAAGYSDDFREITPDFGAAVPEAEIAAARAVLADIVERASKDVAILHESPIVAALLMLKKHASGEYESLVAKLRGVKGVRLRALEGKIRGAESNLRLVGQNDDEVKTLAHYFPVGSPLPELVIPNGYWFTNDATLRFRPQQSPELIAHGAIIVTGRTEDIDGDGHGVRLSWSRGQGWRHKLVNADVIADARALTALSGSDFPVTSVDSKNQVKFLAQVKADNYHRLPVKRTASRFGWMGEKGKECFLIGNQFITAEGDIVEAAIDERADKWDTAGVVFRGNSIGENQIAEGYRPHGNYGDWVNAVVKASAYPVVMATIYASLATPMLQALGCRNFVVSLDGDTSIGKTSAASAGASCWASPEVDSPGAGMTTWGTTRFAVERRCGVLRGLPLILDETKLAPRERGDQKLIPDVIYMVGTGRATSKGQPGGLRAENLFQTILITTGEIPVVDFSMDGGTRNRVLEITAAPFGGKSDKIEVEVNYLNRAFAANYGHAGPKFVQYLIRNRDRWNKWIDSYRSKIELYVAKATDAGFGTGKAGRLAAYAALISQTAEIAHRALELPYRFYDPLETLWIDLARQANDPLNAEKAFEAVISWCNSHQSRFIGREIDDRNAPSAGWAGKWHRQSDEIFIYPHLVEDLLKSKGFPAAEPILKQWREGGKMRTGKDQLRYTVQVRIRQGESSERVYAIHHPNESETQFDDE